MAFAHEVDHGTANSKSSGTTLALSPASTIPVGNLAVVWIACDNRTFQPTGSGTFRSGWNTQLDLAVTDTQGNDYVCIGFCCSAATTDTGAWAAIFVAQIKTAIGTGDTVTATWLRATTAKAMELVEFSHDSENAWSVYPLGGGLRTDAADPGGGVGNMSASGMPNREYLALHCLSAEGPNTDAYTWQAGYTQIGGDGTTGGSDDSNIHLRGGWRIFTGTSTSVNVTSDTADRDYAQWLGIVLEATIPDEFPILPVLDDGSRADENPLSFGGMWSDKGENLAANPGGTANPGLKLASGQFQVANQGHIDNADRYYWDDEILCHWFEVWATIATIPSTTSTAQGGGLPPTNPGNRGLYIVLEQPLPGIQGEHTAYWFRQNRVDPTDGALRSLDAVAISNGIFQGIGLGMQIPMADGHRIGMQAHSAGLTDQRTTHLWVDRGSGWEWICALEARSLETGTPGRYPGMHISGSETRVEDFGGGEYTFLCFDPTIVAMNWSSAQADVTRVHAQR